MPEFIFQKSHFSKIFMLWIFFKIFKMFEKNIFVEKLNDVSIQTCEVLFDPTPMFTGFLSHFNITQRVFLN